MREHEAEKQMDRMLTAYVESLLTGIWGGDGLVVDDDGDYPFRRGTAVGWVSVVTGSPGPGVRVFANAAIAVPRSAKLLAEINDINSRSRFVRVVFRDGVVSVEASLLWIALGEESLGHMIDQVASAANDIGPMIAAVFGGETPFDADDDAADGVPGDDARHRRGEADDAGGAEDEAA